MLCIFKSATFVLNSFYIQQKRMCFYGNNDFWSKPFWWLVSRLSFEKKIEQLNTRNVDTIVKNKVRFVRSINIYRLWGIFPISICC